MLEKFPIDYRDSVQALAEHLNVTGEMSIVILLTM